MEAKELSEHIRQAKIQALLEVERKLSFAIQEVIQGQNPGALLIVIRDQVRDTLRNLGYQGQF